MKSLPYGKIELPLPSVLFSSNCKSDLYDLPQETISKKNDKESEIKMINDALESPNDRQNVVNWINDGDSVAILIPDITRKCPTQLLLEELIPKISKGKQIDIKIIVATGNHRDVTTDEMIYMVGESIYNQYPVLNHDSEGECTHIGTTTRGNEVYINTIVANADKVILIGAANFHTFAGYSGSRKSILPGVSAKSTIMYNHKLMIEETKLNDKTTIGIFNDNPINQDMFEALNLYGIEKLFLYNVVTNVHNELLGVYTGCPIKAFDQAIEKVKSSYSRDYNKKYDVIICSAGGFPSDTNFYQSAKTIELYYEMVKDNGHFLMVAECEDGIGANDELYKKWCSLRGQEFIERLKTKYHNMGTTPYKIDLLTRRGCNLYLVCDYDESMSNIVRMKRVETNSFNDVIEDIVKSYNDSDITPDIAIIPYGCFTAINYK